MGNIIVCIRFAVVFIVSSGMFCILFHGGTADDDYDDDDDFAGSLCSIRRIVVTGSSCVLNARTEMNLANCYILPAATILLIFRCHLHFTTAQCT